MSLDVDSGDINWVWQSESNATAFGTGGVVLAEDGSPIVGGIAFGNQFNLSYDYWEVRTNKRGGVTLDFSSTEYLPNSDPVEIMSVKLLIYSCIFSPLVDAK